MKLSAIDRRKTQLGGIVVAVCAILIVMLLLDRANTRDGGGGYDIKAYFDKADGIGLGSEVRLYGVPVGHVVAYGLDPKYRAVLTLRLDLKKELPDDTSASIETDSLFGTRHIEIVPGGMDETIPPGESIEFTQGSMIIEELLEKVIAQAKRRRGMDTSLPAAAQAKSRAPQNPAQQSPHLPQ